MAVPVARVHLAMAHAALPGLLPTPPELKMAPLLPTPLCAVVLPKQSPPPKPAGRADAVERWDACKNTLLKSSSKPASRADAAERCDARKNVTKASATSSGSSQRSSPDGNSSSSSCTGRASTSCERWDSTTMMKSASPSSLSSSSSSLVVSSCGKRDGTKRPVSRGSSAAERWDAHQKPRPPQLDDGESSSTGSNDMEVDDKLEPQPQLGFYAGPGFLAPPEPSMLPTPSFLVRPRCIVA